MASLGYAVMKYESNTKNTARNVLRSVTAQFSTARTLGAIGDAKISSGLKVSSFFELGVDQGKSPHCLL